MDRASGHFTKFFYLDIKPHHELCFSLEVILTPNPDGLLNREQFQCRYKNVPEVYYFITNLRSWERLRYEDQCQSYMFNLKGRTFYRLRPGRKIFLQTFREGFRICFLTNSNLITAPFKFHNIQHKKRDFYDSTPDCSKKLTYYFKPLENSIPMPSGQSEFVPFIPPRQRNADGTPVHSFKPNHVCYLMPIDLVRYEFVRYGPTLIPSENWIFPLMQKMVNQLNWNEAPRILVMGPSNSGKGRMLNMVMNFGQKKGRPPLLIDIDVGQGCIGVPGTVGLGKIVNQFSVDQEPGNECTFANGYPKLIHFGHTTPDRDCRSYTYALHCLVTLEKEAQLRELKENKLADDPNNSCVDNALGILVNTHGMVEEFGYDSMVTFIENLKIDHIYVHGEKALHDRLFKQLFQLDHIKYVRAINDPKTRIDLPNRMRLKDGFSSRLKPENIIFIPTNPFEKRTNSATRYNLRKERLTNRFRSALHVKVDIDWPDIFYMNSTMNANNDMLSCKAIFDGSGMRYLKFAPFNHNQAMADNFSNRILSVMCRPIQEVREYCDPDNEKCIHIVELLQVQELISLERAFPDPDDPLKYKLTVWVPQYLVDGMKNKEYFLLLHNETITS